MEIQAVHIRLMRFYEIRVILCSHHNINKDRQLKMKLMRLLLSIRGPEINILLGMILSMFLLRKRKSLLSCNLYIATITINNCVTSVWLWFGEGQHRN